MIDMMQGNFYGKYENCLCSLAQAQVRKRLTLREGELNKEPQSSDSSGCERRVIFTAIRRYAGLKCT